MTYRVNQQQRSVSNYELNEDPNGQPYLAQYVHSGPQSASVANIQQLTTLSRQAQQQSAQYYENAETNQTELHRFSQNADRFTNSAVSTKV